MKKENIVRNVVITGGTSGIGESCVEYFKKKGDNVIVIARKNPNNLPNFYPCDVSDEEQVLKTFTAIGQTYTYIDVLVSNAGFGLSGATELTSNSDIQKLFDVNFFGVVNCYKYALPYMKKGSSIINVSSVCAFFPLPFRGFYCASKSAVNLISYTMRMECAPLKIKVTSVCPGDTKTNFTKNRVKNFETNSRYGNRIKSAAESIDSKQEKRMPPIVVAKRIYKISRQKSPKPYVIVGAKYKVLNFFNKILPLRWLLFFTQIGFSGKE